MSRLLYMSESSLGVMEKSKRYMLFNCFFVFFSRFFSRVVSSLFLQGWGTLIAGMIWFSAVIEACGSDLVCQKNTDSIQLQHSLSFSPSSLKLRAFMTTKQGTLMSGGFGRIKTS